MTNFIYLLRKNNIDVDSMYEKGCLEGESTEAKSYIISRREHQPNEKDIVLEGEAILEGEASQR